MDRILDLRSDTVTNPTSEMRHSMMSAKVGDDILREDPTVLKLENLAAEMFGKEDAMLTISGTMSNQIAMALYTKPGDEIIVLENSHLFNLECGGISAIAGAQTRVLKSQTGTFNTNELEKSIMPLGIQRARTKLICLENPYDLNRGLAIAQHKYEDTIKIATQHGIPIFMDGARIFNSAVALDTNVKSMTDFCDSIAICLSKGLAAPLGSLLIGSKKFIEEARWMKQRIGGGMRQAGVFAAPGIIALKDMKNRLIEDHNNAEKMRIGLENVGILVDRGSVLTSIVNMDVSPIGWNANTLAHRLNKSNIKVKVISETIIRMVLNIDINTDDVDFVLITIQDMLKN